MVREFSSHDIHTIIWLIKKAVRRFNLGYSQRNADSEIIFPDEATLKAIAFQHHTETWRGLIPQHEEYIQ